MQSNKVILAAAGSGKTTRLVKGATKIEKKTILIVTYTIANYEEIKSKFYKLNGGIPPNVTIMTWYSFLLSECARPYQNFIYEKKRIKSIEIAKGQSAKYVKKTNTEEYYFRNSEFIYNDKISDFILECDKLSNGLVFARLKDIYDYILIDEIQDLAGYDIELVKSLFLSDIRLVVAGDVRQATYFTNCSRKNSKYKGKNIYNLFKEWEEEKICTIEYMDTSYRCNQGICDLADSLYPDLPTTKSANDTITEHDGIFYILESDLDEYMELYNPQVLRYSVTKRTKYPALNYGASKGLTFDRVLILPTGKIEEWVKTKDIKNVESVLAKFYVAITRARYSVTFLLNKDIESEIAKKFTVQKKNSIT